MKIKLKRFLSASPTPASLALTLAVVFTIVVLVAVAALGGSYLIAFDAAHNATHALNQVIANQHTLQAREATEQIRAAIPTCQTLHSIANDSNALLNSPAGKAAAKTSSQPLYDFFLQFPKIYKSFGCPKVLAFAKTGK